MSDASELIITKLGLEKAQNASISGIKISITQICVSNYLINSSDVASIPDWNQLKGEIVFDTNNYITTDNNIITARKVVADGGSCVIISLHLGYNIGNFVMGSIGCYLDDGTLFCVVKLPQVIEKRKQSSLDPGNTRDFHFPITITDDDIINITMLDSNISTIPEISSYNDLPDADSSEYSMYIVYNYTGEGAPAIATRIETPNGSYWSFTLLAKNGWSNNFIQEQPVKIEQYANNDIIEYDGENETWGKASGEAKNYDVNNYIGVSLQDLSRETLDYNTQIYNKPKFLNSLNQEITIQGVVPTSSLNLLDKTNIEHSNTNTDDPNKVFSTAATQRIITNLEQLINSSNLDNIKCIRPLVFNNETYEIRLLLDTEINSISNNPVQNQAIARELTKYTKRDDLSTVAFSGDYNDLINTPEEVGNITQYVEELPEEPNNFLYELSTPKFTFIGAYNLTDENVAIGYNVNSEGIFRDNELVCSWADLQSNWTSGENYSSLFQLSQSKNGDVVIYEINGTQHFVPDSISDPELYIKKLYYVSNEQYYKEIMLKDKLIDMLENIKYTYMSLSLGASGTVYTITKAGILYLNKKNSAGNLTTTCNISMSNNAGFKSNAYGNSAIANLICQISVRKGDKVTITYNTSGATNTFGLYYLDFSNY